MPVVAHKPEYLHPISLKKIFPDFSDSWHLVNYIPGSPDKISRSLLEYKQNNPDLVQKWNRLAIECIAGLDLSIDHIVRALGSRERTSSGCSPLDDLGRKLAETLHSHYSPGMLLKVRDTRPLHTLNRKDRMQELSSVYVCNSFTANAPSNILVIDDLVTTGATLSAIRKAILKEYGNANVYFFTLAKTFFH